MTPRALLSVSDKRGLIELGQALVHDHGFGLVASGGTARALKNAGLPVMAVSDLTGFPEILGGRVKTLHPAIHGSILARPTEAHQAELHAHGLAPISLVVCNLYPFEDTLAAGSASDEAGLVEKIDIGGVTLLRAAAKNFEAVTVLCDPDDYTAYLERLKADALNREARRHYAAQAFAHTARYDAAIANWLVQRDEDTALPSQLPIAATRLESLRYGENPHQGGAFYAWPGTRLPFAQVQGLKALSYNNIMDLDAAWAAVSDFDDAPAVVIVKHTNPCGLAQADALPEAFELALASDPVSAFGSIIAVNRTLDVDTLERVGRLFVEVFIAPDYTEEALAWLARRKKNCRVIQAGAYPEPRVWLRSVAGGLLAQTPDVSPITEDAEGWRVVTERQPTPPERASLAFAARVARHVKSNAIVFVQGRATVGVGAGQMNRLESVQLAAQAAGEQAQGAALASDAFFPFPDGVEAAAEAGVTAVIQPGGSIRDEQVIEAANRLGLTMVLTGHRHFRH